MSDKIFKNNVLLFAEVIIPDLQDNKLIQEALFKNFSQLLNQLEYQADSKVKMLVKVIEFLSIVYHFKAFNKLTYSKRKVFINRLFQLPVAKIVAGLTGLRSLVLISYYGLEEVVSKINSNSVK